MDLKLPIAAITDEFTPDLEAAADAMVKIGMTGAELRVLWGKNIMNLTDEELTRARQILDSRGLKVMSIASPLLKCVLPDAPEIDSRFQQDVFASVHTFEDQPALATRAFNIAHKTGAKIIRVFSYWRTVEPPRCFDRIAEALQDLGDKAAKEDLIIGLENEHGCNLGTGAEVATVLKAVNHPNVKLVWDPANALVAGESRPYPDGYRLLPPSCIVHVHVKDCYVEGHKPNWGPLGACSLDWKGQIAALLADGYRGYFSLETHWPGPGGDKFQASVTCGWIMKWMLAA